jgi:hypothetical protein
MNKLEVKENMIKNAMFVNKVYVESCKDNFSSLYLEQGAFYPHSIDEGILNMMRKR